MRSAPARPVHASFVRSCCNVVVQEHLSRAWVQQRHKALSELARTLHISSFHLVSHSSHMSATFCSAFSVKSTHALYVLSTYPALLHVSKVEQLITILHRLKVADQKIFTILRSLMPSVGSLQLQNRQV